MNRASFVSAVPADQWDEVMSRNRASRISFMQTQPKGDFLNFLQHKRRSTESLIDQDKVKFVTESSYSGEWDKMDTMTGTGTYVMPHGVEYEGDLLDGRFHGDGVLTYPSKAQVFGKWNKGTLMSLQHRYSDSLDYASKRWKYCELPDRRYQLEVTDGLQPAGSSNITEKETDREIPEGCYDTGEGFYNHKTRCLTSPTGQILRIPTDTEAAWIMENCRRSSSLNAGYRPDLFDQKAVHSPSVSGLVSSMAGLGVSDLGPISRRHSSQTPLFQTGRTKSGSRLRIGSVSRRDKKMTPGSPDDSSHTSIANQRRYQKMTPGSVDESSRTESEDSLKIPVFGARDISHKLEVLLELDEEEESDYQDTRNASIEEPSFNNFRYSH